MNSFLSSTILNFEDFDRVFTEVDHGSSLELENNNTLQLFQLDIQNYHFRLDGLKDFLDENIGRYVFSRAQRDGLVKDGKSENIGKKATRSLRSKGLIDEKGCGKELGEMLIYIFLEQVLKAPKLMSKVELSFLDETSQTEGIHLHTVVQNKREINQLIFGVSSIVGDLGDSITQVEQALQRINKDNTKEIRLIEENILSKSFDDKITKKIKEMLIPSDKRFSKPESAYGIFLGYTLGLESATRTPTNFQELVGAKLKQDIKDNLPRIKEAINRSGLSGYSFYIYVLPFDDAEDDKLEIMRYVLEGGE